MSVVEGDPSGVPTLAAHFRDMAANNRWSNARLHAACAALAPRSRSSVGSQDSVA